MEKARNSVTGSGGHWCVSYAYHFQKCRVQTTQDKQEKTGWLRGFGAFRSLRSLRVGHSPLPRLVGPPLRRTDLIADASRLTSNPFNNHPMGRPRWAVPFSKGPRAYTDEGTPLNQRLLYTLPPSPTPEGR